MEEKLIKKIKKEHPKLIFRYTYVFQGPFGNEFRLVFRGKDYSHYEFSLDGELIYREE